MEDCAPRLLLLGDMPEVPIPIPGSLLAPDGAEILEIALGYRLGPIRIDAEQACASLYVTAKYLLASGEVHATEWFETSIHFHRHRGTWGCTVGPDWYWSSDWPSGM